MIPLPPQTSLPLSPRWTTRRSIVIAIATVWLATIPAAARAVDGCLVLLCLAAPSWTAVPQCVPPVRQVFSDLAHGKPFPTCDAAGFGSSAANLWSSAPAFCPPQYTQSSYAEGEPIYTCDYAGAIEVSVEGVLWSRTWWDTTNGSVTEFTPTAKSQLGSWNTQFDDDYAKWVALQNQGSTSCEAC